MSKFTKLPAEERHQALVSAYLRVNDRQTHENGKQRSHGHTVTELDVLKEHHQFLREDEVDPTDLTWEERVALKYYQQLFKEYTLADLSRYKEGKIAMRWRTQREVVTGKGQFICGRLGCDASKGLVSWEVPFRYKEQGEKKMALVKLRLCPECSDKLNYKKRKQMRAEEPLDSTAKKRKVQEEEPQQQPVHEDKKEEPQKEQELNVQPQATIKEPDDIDLYLADLLQ